MKKKKRRKKRDKVLLAIEAIIYLICPFALFVVLGWKTILGVTETLGLTERRNYPEDDQRHRLDEFYDER